MKKFIVSVLSISVFFIGLGSLIEKTSAKFKSDEKALALIAQARQAIGGDANIKNVRSMTIIGNTTHTFEAEGIQRNEAGNLEINFELPGKFNKMVRIGNPDSAKGEGELHKQVDVIVMRKNDGTTDVKGLGDGRKVVIVKDGDGKVLTEDFKPADGQRKIIIKKDDGTVQEIKPGDKDMFVFERKSGDSATWKTEDGNRIFVDKDVRAGGGVPRQNEMFRTTFALLLSAPEGTDANFLYAGEGAVDGNSCDIIEVQSAGSSFKLYLDKSSHLPRMLSYMGMPMMKAVKLERQSGDAPKEDVVLMRKIDKAELVEHQVRFSDFRSVGGLLLPHKWTGTVGGNSGETVDITSYEINPANIADKFQNQKIFIRTQQPQ